MVSAEAEIARQGTFGVGVYSQLAEASRLMHLGPESCLPPASHRSDSRVQDTQREFDDNSHGVRFLSAFATWAIVVPVFLTNTVRSQGFSPSQRFDPARALWLCFTPHPPLGFALAFRAFPSQPAVTPLGALCSLVVSACAGFTRANSRSTFAPVGCYSSTASRFPVVIRIVCSCNPDRKSRHQLDVTPPK